MLTATQPDHEALKRKDEKRKAEYKKHYDQRHGVKQLPDLEPGWQVKVKLDQEKYWSKPGHISLADPSSRSYQVALDNGGTVR